jgi:hypothetical protein
MVLPRRGKLAAIETTVKPSTQDDPEQEGMLNKNSGLPSRKRRSPGLSQERRTRDIQSRRVRKKSKNQKLRNVKTASCRAGDVVLVAFYENDNQGLEIATRGSQS